MCQDPCLEYHFGILHYRQLYINRPDRIAFLPAAVDTTGRLYDDFSRLLLLHAHREASALTNEIPEESDQFRFLRVACYANIKGSVGFILAKASDVRISTPLDLSSRPFIPLPRFICRRRPLSLLAPELLPLFLLLDVLSKRHMRGSLIY